VNKGNRVALLFLALLLPIVVHAGDYPSGAWTSGVVSNVATFHNGYVRFVITGTKANGQAGTEAFFLDTQGHEGKTQYANVLAAATQGRTMNIWHYGDWIHFGGQSGYSPTISFANY
jgi:hypothetical protein